MNDKNVVLNKGVYRSPGIGEAGQLEECVNLMVKNGELVNVPRPSGLGVSVPDGSVLKWVHENGSYRHYICVEEKTWSKEEGEETVEVVYSVIRWCDSDVKEWKEIASEKNIGKVEAVKSTGNVLIVADGAAMHYILWKEGDYKYLGDHLPEAKVKFTVAGWFDDKGKVLSGARTLTNTDGEDPETTGSKKVWRPGMLNYVYSVKGEGYHNMSKPGEYYGFVEDSEAQDEITKCAYGVLNHVSRTATEQGLMVHAHLMRYALRLYDGSYAMMSAPFLVYNSGENYEYWLNAGRGTGGQNFNFIYSKLKAYVPDFFIMNQDELEKWGDVVKGITFFASDPIREYDQAKKIKGEMGEELCNTGYADKDPKEFLRLKFDVEKKRDVKDELKGVSQFYKVDDVDLEEYASGYGLLVIQSDYGKRVDGDNTNKLSVTVKFSDDQELSVNGYHNEVNTEHKLAEKILTEASKLKGIKARQVFSSKAYPELTLVSGHNSEQHVSEWGLRHDKIGIVFYGKKPVSISSVTVTNAIDQHVNVYSTNSFGRMMELPDMTAEALRSNKVGPDEFRSHRKVVARTMFENNKALNLGDVILTEDVLPLVGVEVLSSDLPGRKAPECDLTKVISVVFRIKTDEGHKYAKETKLMGRDETGTLRTVLLSYIYHPDGRADKCYFRTGDDCYELDMEPSNVLSGAVWAPKVLPYYYEESDAMGWPVQASLLNDATKIELEEYQAYYDKAERGYTERIGNAVVKMRSGNPFMWDASGWEEVGHHQVIGMSTINKPLWQGQSEGFQLYCFCTDGVWALKVGDDGKFASKHAVSQDVCSNPKGILQTNDAIVFPTLQGLKVIRGNEAVELTPQMRGRRAGLGKVRELLSSTGMGKNYLPLLKDYDDDFAKVIETAVFVYDYANDAALIYPEDVEMAYVVSVKTGEVTTWVGEDLVNSPVLVAALSGWPCSVAQTSKGALVQFDGSIDGGSQYKSVLVTRPLHFDNAMAMKAMIDARIVMSAQDELSIARMGVLVSNDGVKWSAMPSLKHGSYRWYKLVMCVAMTDVCSLNAVVCRVEERRSRNFR